MSPHSKDADRRSVAFIAGLAALWQHGAMIRRRSSFRARLRFLAEGCIALVIAGAVLQTWLLDGLVIPCRVVGGSMAETLLGVHREVICGDCGHTFTYGSDTPPLPDRAICPNCGYAGNDSESLPELRGDGVLIDRVSFALRGPHRWETIAFRSGQGDDVAVKRVVGLPGETVQVRHGDVYIDGQLQHKTLAEQHAVAVLVHDADHEPHLSPVPPSRWQPETPGNGWQSDAGRFSHAAASEASAVDWLVYRHWRRLSAGAISPIEGQPEHSIQPTTCESPVTDLCGYDQSQPRREEDVHPVADLLLSVQLEETTGLGELILRATDGGEEFSARLLFGNHSQGGEEGDRSMFSDGAETRVQANRPKNGPVPARPEQPHYEILRQGQPIAGAVGDIPTRTGGRTIEFSLIDRQVLLAFDGRTAISLAYDCPEPPPTPPTAPLAIGVKGLGVVLSDLRVYRDVYYTHPIGLLGDRGLTEPVRLADDEYYVLGDNSPVSEDSRTWPVESAV